MRQNYFKKANESDIQFIQNLARDIWQITYAQILSTEQIEYMLDMMYNKESILKNLHDGEIWEVFSIEDIPVGYLHYKIEGERVFLSKIYLSQDPKYKGSGKLMMNHVFEYATSENKKYVYLTVNKNNAKAIHFYEKNNFINLESKVTDIGKGYVMDDYIFQKEV